jgi:N-acetylmuramoyl-L-alanine amidase
MERENRVIRLEDDQDHYKQYDNASNAQQALARSSFMRHSEMLAESIQAQFTDVVKRRDRGVKQAGFYVLFGALMPSVLIELGFLSNPLEEKFLSTIDGQASMANAIFRAVQDFKFGYERSLRAASE